MKLPLVLYGQYKEVRKEGLKMIRKIRKGAALRDIEELKTTVDPQDYSGLLILGGPITSYAHQDHFQCFIITGLLDEDLTWDRIPQPRYPELFSELIATDWGVLSLMANLGPGEGWSNRFVRYRDFERWREFLEAVLKRWEDFKTYGERFRSGTEKPRDITMAAGILLDAAIELGVKNPEARQIIASGDISSFKELLHRDVPSLLKGN
jgi:hypothetical protein